MTLDRSDDAILGRLIERARLLIAINDELPSETKLQTQPLLKELERLLAVPADQRDVGRIRQTHGMLVDFLEDDANVEALLSAMNNFLPE